MTQQNPNHDPTSNDGLDAIPQEILDRLTRVDMPAVHGIDASPDTLTVGDITVPVYSCETLVLGSGEYHLDGVHTYDAGIQSSKSDYGKVIAINLTDGNHPVVTAIRRP